MAGAVPSATSATGYPGPDAGDAMHSHRCREARLGGSFGLASHGCGSTIVNGRQRAMRSGSARRPSSG
eukprot:4477864-Alexandrium_andersonii.AAC.1